MRTHLQNGLAVLLSSALLISAASLRADQLQMQNGDRYAGRILSVTSDTIVFQSDALGKLTLARDKVSMLEFTGAAPAASNSIPRIPAKVAAVPASPSPNGAVTNSDISAALRNLGANTNFIQQVRQQMLSGGTPAVNQKYDEIVAGLMSGQMNLNDLRNQAKAAISQIQQIKRETGPEADASLDTYLAILQNFVNETESSPATATPTGVSGTFGTNSPDARP